jgi:hypothetical protein
VTRPRFVVAETSGLLRIVGGHTTRHDGLTVMVLDRAYCYEVVWSIRTEDFPPGKGSLKNPVRITKARTLAREAAARFNAQDKAEAKLAA